MEVDGSSGMNTLNATLVGRRDVTDELVFFSILPDAGVPDFIAGQSLALGLPASHPRPAHFPPPLEELDGTKIIKRAYSVGSSPLERDALEFYIAIVPQGALTPCMQLLKVGDRLFAHNKPVGIFTVENVPADQNLVFVSTGTGIAPYISMLRTPSTHTTGRSITLLHGVRYPVDLAYDAELSRMATERPHFHYHPVVSRGGANWSGHAGHVQRLFENGVVPIDPTRDHVYLCGNPAMIEELQPKLELQGYALHSRKTPGNLHLESYW